MSGEYKETRTANQRIAFDDDNTDSNNTDGVLSTATIKAPQESEHWQSLVHEDGDNLIHTLEELKSRFSYDIFIYTPDNSTSISTANRCVGELMAFWSCLSGYCEALATHKEPIRRYEIFPIPVDALRRLVKNEFRSRVLAQAEASIANTAADTSSLEAHQAKHRSLVRSVANAVWDTAVNKSQKKDEDHANSLYVCLRGHIDRKSIDCLGSSVTTVAGVKILQARDKIENDNVVVTSMLTLSEDHAYEKHIIRSTGNTADSNSATAGILEGTCEVAIPGSTKRQKAKRACEIADTFRDKKACSLLTPESSWLYMAKHPIVCSTGLMSLVPIVANINCNIRSKTPGSAGTSKGSSLESRQLYRLKRELLWELYDLGAMKSFPFGILELGDCEGTVGSERGEQWILSKSPLVKHGEPILRNEEFFLEAIGISRERHDDAQVYPYYYAGHYHKDAGGTTPQPCLGGKIANTNDGSYNSNGPVYDDNEHRFTDALRMYSEAARVTSKYRFDTGDCLQLNKHLTSVTALIHEDILTIAPPKSAEGTSTKTLSRIPRSWIHRSNAVGCCFWLLRLFDYLLYWEEWSSEASSNAGLTSKNPRFVEILQLSHKSFVGKLLNTFDEGIRNSALDDFFADCGTGDNKESSSSTASCPSSFPISKRLRNQTTLLAKSLRAAKVQIRDIALTILDDDDDDDVGGRRGRSSKRRKRS